jgi:hypothetical protein
VEHLEVFLALGFVPGMPDVELEPDLVLVIFLPPLLYSAAFFSDLGSLRADLRPVSMLAIGLVLVTMCAVAVVGHEVIGLTWPLAFALGAIVSPTDPVAATAIMRPHVQAAALLGARREDGRRRDRGAFDLVPAADAGPLHGPAAGAGRTPERRRHQLRQ